jgi:acyl-coenzyme A thioesterase PaaI-like protein
MRRMIQGRLTKPPIRITMNRDLFSAGAGRAVFAGIEDTRVINPVRKVLADYVSTLLDLAMTCAMQTMVAARFGVRTAEGQLLAESHYLFAHGTANCMVYRLPGAS